MHPLMVNGKPVGQQSVKKESDGTRTAEVESSGGKDEANRCLQKHMRICVKCRSTALSPRPASLSA